MPEIQKQEPSKKYEVEKFEDERRVRLSKPGRMAEIDPGSDVLPLAVDLYLPPDSVLEKDKLEIVISVHGQGSNADFDKDVISELQKQSIVIAPTTSRRTAFNPADNPDFEAWMADSFEGKKYPDEVQDFEDGIKAGLQELKKITKGKDVRVVFIGYSLGGAMAADLAKRHKPDKVILIAPSLDLSDKKERPIIGPNVPNPDHLVKNLQNSEVTVIWGTNDPFIPRENAEIYTADGGEIIEIEGAGHTFGKIPVLPGDHENKRKELVAAIKSVL